MQFNNENMLAAIENKTATLNATKDKQHQLNLKNYFAHYDLDGTSNCIIPGCLDITEEREERKKSPITKLHRSNAFCRSQNLSTANQYKNNQILTNVQ